MPASRESSAEVLIIGAGPSGLFAACELARHGVQARLIEQESGPHQQSRATGIQPSTLEVFHRAGLLHRFLESAHPIHGAQILDHALAPAFSTSFAGMDTPYSFLCSIPQWRTEELLEEHLTALGGAVQRRTCAESIVADAGGSRVRLRHADGTAETVWAKYLVGACGARGLVRGVLHEHLEGTTYPFRYLVADLTGDIPLATDRVCLAISKVGLVMIAQLPEKRWLAVIDLPEGDLPQQAPALEDVRAAMQTHLRTVPQLHELRWASVFHTHRRIAPRFGDDCRFLVGDAAHICSPFGGEGMNAGLQDGADLAWKLALVSQGLGRSVLLDAYEMERQCAANQVLASADAARNMYYRLVEMAATGQKITPPPRDDSHPVTAPSMLDLSWPDSPIVGELTTGAARSLPRPGQRFRDRTKLHGTKHHLLVFEGTNNAVPDLEQFRQRWSRQVETLNGNELGAEVAARAGLDAGGAVLVRPDGFVGYRTDVWNPAALAALDAHLEKQLVPV